ncbi:DUF2219 family protein [Flavobacterium sp. NST-5]|uniref:DUF2219 family protein n=1 Tax=Flavobacterium ichthyis TaxID=2698827 RepID=A0ABW9Z7V2_9FLAO|nr:lipid A deacylase LpxR family protein [Flavobacterium ichthyis]NBL64657.1 DUF2219 family protein [Flavobacterium ichthyis]
MRKKIPHFLLIFFTSTFAQHRAEIGIAVDNDLFTSSVYDRYYTSGIDIFYRYLNEIPSEEILKQTTEFHFGQKIYNPYTVEAADIRKHDRPFAGFLYGEFASSKFYQNQSYFKIGTQAGVIGPASGAEDFQKLFHKTFGYKNVEGWQYQIQNTLVLQLESVYAKLIASGEDVDFLAKANVSAGTAFTQISAGPIARFALWKKLLPMHESNLLNASLQREKEAYKTQKEFYFYVNPSLNYQLYDATIQGSLFNDQSPVTYNLIPFRFNAEAGLRYRSNHWNLHYLFIYRGKELSNYKIEGYFYGSIGASYLIY